MATAISSVRTSLEEDLQRVLEGAAHPQMWFQPIADLRRGVVAGYEALVRLPVQGTPAPDVCLRAAAQIGCQIELEAIIATAAMAAREQLPLNTFLSMNVSPGFLCSSAWDRLARGQQDLQGLVIEITEGELIEDYDQMRRKLAAIHAMGGLTAIDDAGSGYAGLKQILELRPNFIKLDRGLVQDCDKDRAKSAMIELLGSAANRMDAWVITEGIETPHELQEVIGLDVPLAQGFFLGRSCPFMQALTAEAEQLIRSLTRSQPASKDLRLLAEPCASVLLRQQAEQFLVEDGDLVALVDEWDRPVELLERHPVVGKRSIYGLIRCHPDCDPSEVLERALTRPPSSRLDPVLLTDEEGRLKGAVRIDRLMLAVLGDLRTMSFLPPNTPPV